MKNIVLLTIVLLVGACSAAIGQSENKSVDSKENQDKTVREKLPVYKDLNWEHYDSVSFGYTKENGKHSPVLKGYSYNQKIYSKCTDSKLAASNHLPLYRTVEYKITVSFRNDNSRILTKTITNVVYATETKANKFGVKFSNFVVLDDIDVLVVDGKSFFADKDLLEIKDGYVYVSKGGEWAQFLSDNKILDAGATKLERDADANGEVSATSDAGNGTDTGGSTVNTDDKRKGRIRTKSESSADEKKTEGTSTKSITKHVQRHAFRKDYRIDRRIAESGSIRFGYLSMNYAPCVSFRAININAPQFSERQEVENRQLNERPTYGFMWNMQVGMTFRSTNTVFIELYKSSFGFSSDNAIDWQTGLSEPGSMVAHKYRIFRDGIGIGYNYSGYKRLFNPVFESGVYYSFIREMGDGRSYDDGVDRIRNAKDMRASGIRPDFLGLKAGLGLNLRLGYLAEFKVVPTVYYNLSTFNSKQIATRLYNIGLATGVAIRF